MSPTQRSLNHLRDNGYTAQIVEKWNAFAKVRQDVFGFGDILAFRVGMPGSVLVQTTSTPNMAARRKKILANQTALEWLLAGNWIRLDGWALRGKRGKRKVWTLSHEYLTVDAWKE